LLIATAAVAQQTHNQYEPPNAPGAGQKLAENEFDVLLTVDTNLRYQQSLEGCRIAIVVLQSSSNRLEHLRPYFPACVSALERIKPGEVVQIGGTD
jgi:hypothetical protein